MPPNVGTTVLVRTPKEYNGSNVHPGVVTRVWSKSGNTAYVNLKVLPDGGSPYDETSITVYATQMEGESSPSPTRYAFAVPERDETAVTG